MAGAVLLAALAWPAAGGVHQAGRLSFSLGGSLAHTQNEEVRHQAGSQIVYDDYVAEIPATEDRDTFTDIDISVFLSSGYFPLDRTEFGVLGSTMLTQYSGTDRDNFSVYDGQLYAKYFFDNESTLTPFVKLHGGLSWMKSGDYNEENGVVGLVGGLEYYGLGPLAWFMELSSQYTELGGDRTGYEWRNQIYLGMSLYVDLRRAEHEAEQRATQQLQYLSPEIRRWVLQADREWGPVLDDIDRRTVPVAPTDQPTK